MTLAVTQDVLLSRSSLHDWRLTTGQIDSLGDGEALLKVEAFGITANNVSYAYFGDEMRYWDHFPASSDWGRVPVWGFATVLESRAADVAPGRRLYGYLPMSTHLTVKPERVSDARFVDGAAHRRSLPSGYQRYLFCDRDPLWRPDTEPLQLLFRPLFMTAFMIDDLLADNAFYGAERVLLSSASAKTAYALAGLLKARGMDAIGLTSPRNASFASDIGLYGDIVGYPQIEMIDPNIPTAFVDLSGDRDVVARVHQHFGAALKLSLSVGFTHWEQHEANAAAEPTGLAPQFFFAGERITKRFADWGAEGFAARSAAAFESFLPTGAALAKVVTAHSLEQAAHVFAAHIAGSVSPRDGHVVNLS